MQTAPRASVEALLLRPGELAVALGISRSRAYELLTKNELPGIVRLGRSVRISKRALETWLAERTGTVA